MKKIYWNADLTPVETTLDRLVYELRKEDAGLIFDAVTMTDIYEDSDGMMPILDALISPFAKLDLKMSALQKVMERAGGTIQPLKFTISEAFTLRNTANVAIIFELSDGQTVSIFLRNSDVINPKKIVPADDMLSWKWMLNKKDCTVAVAPETGTDLDLRKVAARIMKLAEKNSALFAKGHAKRTEQAKAVEYLKVEVNDLEAELKAAQHRLEIAKVEKDDREIAAVTNPVVEPEIIEPTPEPAPIEIEPTLNGFSVAETINELNTDYGTNNDVWNATVSEVQALSEGNYSKLIDALENANYGSQLVILKATRNGDSKLIDAAKELEIEHSEKGSMSGVMMYKRSVLDYAAEGNYDGIKGIMDRAKRYLNSDNKDDVADGNEILEFIKSISPEPAPIEPVVPEIPEGYFKINKGRIRASDYALSGISYEPALPEMIGLKVSDFEGIVRKSPAVRPDTVEKRLMALLKKQKKDFAEENFYMSDKDLTAKEHKEVDAYLDAKRIEITEQVKELDPRAEIKEISFFNRMRTGLPNVEDFESRGEYDVSVTFINRNGDEISFEAMMFGDNDEMDIESPKEQIAEQEAKLADKSSEPTENTIAPEMPDYKVPELPQGGLEPNESDLGLDEDGYDERNTLESLLEGNEGLSKEYTKFLTDTGFLTKNDIENNDEYDRDEIDYFEYSAFFIDQQVKSHGGSVAWGEFDNTLHTRSLFDSVANVGGVCAQIADKNSVVLARVIIEENGMTTFLKGDSGSEKIGTPTAKKAGIESGVDFIFKLASDESSTNTVVNGESEITPPVEIIEPTPEIIEPVEPTPQPPQNETADIDAAERNKQWFAQQEEMQAIADAKSKDAFDKKMGEEKVMIETLAAKGMTPMDRLVEINNQNQKLEIDAELESLKSETDYKVFDKRLDDLAAKIEDAGLMDEYEPRLNDVADILTVLLKAVNDKIGG